jgi:hypothetical protein
MADQRDTTLAKAIQDVTDKAQILVREEIELAKVEVTTKVAKLARGGAIGAAAAVFVLGALLLILHGIAWLLWFWLFPQGQFFWGFFMEAAILLLVGAFAGYLAARAFKAGSPPAPKMAIQEAKLIRETVTSEHPGRTV